MGCSLAGVELASVSGATVVVVVVVGAILNHRFIRGQITLTKSEGLTRPPILRFLTATLLSSLPAKHSSTILCLKR